MAVVVTREEMTRLDRATIDDIGITAAVLMETAGRAIAAEALARNPRRVIAVAGSGNNGGDAFVAARTLFQRGVEITIVDLGRAHAGQPTARARRGQ